MRSIGVAAMVCLVTAALVAGCGKKGAPKPPSDTEKTEQSAS